MIAHISQKINVSKTRLLETLRYNRTEHAKELVILRKNYLDTIRGKLETAEKDLTKVNEIRHVLPPEDHTKDYDQLIAMLEYADNQNIDLTSSEFDQFVQDNWDWKDRNRNSSSLYNK